MPRQKLSDTTGGIAVRKPITPVNPPHGERGGFRKMSVTLPPEAYELIVQESARRKIAGEPHHLFSAVIREAVVEYLGKGLPRAGNSR